MVTEAYQDNLAGFLRILERGTGQRNRGSTCVARYWFQPFFFSWKKSLLYPKSLRADHVVFYFLPADNQWCEDSSVTGKTIGEGTFGKAPWQHVCITSRCHPTPRNPSTVPFACDFRSSLARTSWPANVSLLRWAMALCLCPLYWNSLWIPLAFLSFQLNPR